MTCRSLLKTIKPSYLLILGGLLLIFAFRVGYLFAPSVDTETLRTLLPVMIGSQASVLAIVISVTLISTQLVATRYAPRMATLPFRTTLFKSAFAIFAGSIILDLVLLLSISSSNTPLYNGFLIVGLALFTLVFILLYPFARQMVQYTSPERLVSLFTETISRDEYISRVRELSEVPKRSAHPLQPLYRFIMSALSKNEHATARAALDQYHEYTSDMLEDLNRLGVFDKDSVEYKKELFGPVLVEHLHSITVHAAEKDDSRVLSSAVDAQTELGIQGMEVGSGRCVPGQALNGLKKSIIEAPVTSEDHTTFNKTWPAVSMLMQEETKYDQHRVLLTGSHMIETRLPASLARSNESGWHTDALRELFRNLCEGHERVIGKIAEGPGLNKIDLTERPEEYDKPVSDLANQARYTRKAIIEATSEFLRHRITDGDYPATEGNFRSGWQDLVISVADKGAHKHAVWLSEALVELAFIENLHRPYNEGAGFWPTNETGKDRDYLYWTRELREISKETDSPVVEEAFNSILEYEFQSETTPVLTFPQDPAEEDYYRTKLNMPEYRSLNAIDQFPDLIEELREKSSLDQC